MFDAQRVAATCDPAVEDLLPAELETGIKSAFWHILDRATFPRALVQLAAKVCRLAMDDFVHAHRHTHTDTHENQPRVGLSSVVVMVRRNGHNAK